MWVKALNETETVFPGSNLKLFFSLVSDPGPVPIA